jgi:hypothetical protein
MDEIEVSQSIQHTYDGLQSSDRDGWRDFCAVLPGTNIIEVACMDVGMGPVGADMSASHTSSFVGAVFEMFGCVVVAKALIRSKVVSLQCHSNPVGNHGREKLENAIRTAQVSVI